MISMCSPGLSHLGALGYLKSWFKLRKGLEALDIHQKVELGALGSSSIKKVLVVGLLGGNYQVVGLRLVQLRKALVLLNFLELEGRN